MIEFWTVEDTGWSNGISWFKTGGTDANPLRFESYEAALSYALDKKERCNPQRRCPTTKWRVVHTTIDRAEYSEVTTRKWKIV